MELKLSQEMLDALHHAGHVPEDLKRCLDAIAPVQGAVPPQFRLVLSEDEAMELSELLQWHVRSDPVTGQPTPETAPYAAIIQAIADQQF
ncbi:MAG: hypothetical protein HYR48_00985 [Gemmatimonadetes bacterium]|nr:hypothetical protein [Gemmatimonadota bacterium]